MIPDLITIGPFTLHSFGLLAALALIVPAYFVAQDLRQRGRDPVLAWEFAVGAGIGGFAGARIDFLIQNGGEGGLFSSTGLVWYGGVIGGFAGVALVSLWRKVPLGIVANIMAPALALGYAIGRIGCQLSGDGDYGSASSLPWAMSYPDGEVPTLDLVHPTPLYETTAMLVAFYALWRLRGRFDGRWELFGLWCILAGIERFLVEFIRRNEAQLLGLTTAQLVSAGLLVLGVLLMGAGRSRRRTFPEPSSASPSRA
jgi:phosphatidylglycerol:prolipoprotein diacylglycerol transferase